MAEKDLAKRKAAIVAEITKKLEGDWRVYANDEIGLNDLRRYLAWNLPSEPLTQDGRFVAKLLNGMGYRREGWLGTGYDREPRYVPEARS